MFQMKELPKYCSSLGNYNNLPEPHVECPIGELWYHFFSEYVELEYRQCKMPWLKSDNPFHIRTCQIFWFPSQAFVLFTPTEWMYKRDGLIVPTYYEDAPRCYKIGCEHKWKRTTIRMCEHEDKCEKCGLAFIVDSSD